MAKKPLDVTASESRKHLSAMVLSGKAVRRAKSRKSLALIKLSKPVKLSEIVRDAKGG